MPAPPAPTPRPPGRLRRVLGGLRTAWSILGLTLLLLVGLELGLRLVFAIKDRISALPETDPRIIAEGYDGADWVAAHFREYRAGEADWHPYVYFRGKPREGATIQVGTRGLRRTWVRPPGEGGSGSKAARIWFFGGSTAWGVGARDEYTIPSLVAKRLEERGIPAEVNNFAEVGYVSTQDVLALLLELRDGRSPDVAVFLDGVNDVLAAYQSGRAGLPQNEDHRRKEFEDHRSPARQILGALGDVVRDSALFRLAKSARSRAAGRAPVSDFAPPAQTDLSQDELAGRILDVYGGNLRVVGALGREFGFSARFYWQPTIFTKKLLTPFEAEERAKYASFEPLFLATSALVPRREADLGDRFRDLSHALDDSDRLLFTDFCHLTESANAVVAEAIADDLAGMIRSQSAGSPADHSGNSGVER